MSAAGLDELNFLLKLQACRDYRAYLTHPGFHAFRAKAKICQRLAQDGLVDFSREIVAVRIAAAGQALLKLAEPPVAELELKLLRKIASAKQISPSQLKANSLTALQRDALLQSFLNRGLIEAETRLKRQRAEVWLTPQGQTCLAELLNQFQAFRQRPHGLLPKPSDAEVLELIRSLDHEQGGHNYLPLFHLRQKLPFLSPAELDEILYRLQQTDRIELRDLVHTEAYSTEQLNAAIQTRTGRLLFFVRLVAA
ncbi:MAG: transcription factor RcaD [Elainella sp.]